MFGIVWGTASVIFLVGWGEGTSTMLEDAVTRTGKNMGEVWAGKLSEEFTPAVDRRYLWFTPADVAALRRRARVPELVGAEAWETLPVVSGPRSLSVDVRGMDAEAVAIRGIAPAAGEGQFLISNGHGVLRHVDAGTMKGGPAADVTIAGASWDNHMLVTRFRDA